MSVGRCTRCLGHKKATYMGGIYVNCQQCNGTGYISLPEIIEPVVNEPIHIAENFIGFSHTEIKPELTFESSKALINSIPEVKAEKTKYLDFSLANIEKETNAAFDNLSNLSDIDDKIDNQLAQSKGNRIDKRSKAYRDQKLKAALDE